MDGTLADTIREITREHLTQNNGMLLGQALTAVGFVNNTVPDGNCPNVVEMPMSDLGAAGIAVGVAITGRRPIFIIRFQDFAFLNGNPIVMYAAKVKHTFGKSAPIFIRAITTEDYGAGIVHSSCLHSLFAHMPGMRVCAPMTPNEYRQVWQDFMEHDDPMYCSEHRWSFQNSKEMPNYYNMDKPDITIYAVSASRFNAIKAVEILEKEGIGCNLVHVFHLKPLVIDHMALEIAPLGLVVDSDYGICGVAEHIAYELMSRMGVLVKALARRDESMGVGEHLINGTPTAERIVATVKEMLGKKNTN